MSTIFTKAISNLLLDEPFFGTLALAQKPEEIPDIPTAATDGKKLLYNKEYIESLSNAHRKGLIAHEVLHIAFGHHLRGHGKVHQVWNAACDYAVNPIVLEAGLHLPEGGLIDNKYKGWTAEAIYNDIFERGERVGVRFQPQDGDESGNPLTPEERAKSAFGEVRQAPEASSEAEREEALSELKIEVAKAARAAKNQGKLSANMERLVAEIIEPKVNWKEQLRRFTTSFTKNDFSWSAPNRRYLWQDIYLPSLRTPSLGYIAIAIDTSGSVTQKELDIFASELNGIFETASPERVQVIYCDSQVNKTEEFTQADLPLNLKMCGGGGTDFRPVFEHLDNEQPPSALVYFTDMYGSFPKEAPMYPTMWLATSKEKAPFGETIPYSDFD